MSIHINGVELCNVGDIKVGAQDVVEVYVGSTKVFPCVGGAISGAITSKPYPLQQTESMQGSGAAVTFAESYGAFRESIESASASIQSGTLSDIAVRHTVHDDDIAAVESSGALIQSGVLDEIAIRHTVHDDDIAAVESSSAAILSGSIDAIVIRHTVYDVPKVESTGAAIISGTLEAA